MAYECPQCGMFHPPLPKGERCPMAKTSQDGQEVNFELLFVPLRNIVESQISNKKIKNQKKLFGAVVVEITKFLESYKED